MEIVKPGHIYKLNQLDGNSFEQLNFVCRHDNDHHPRTYNQEVLRALIDRIKFLDQETPWPMNKDIIKHLQMALVLHESRALARKVEKDELSPESVPVGDDGHFIFLDENNLNKNNLDEDNHKQP